MFFITLIYIIQFAIADAEKLDLSKETSIPAKEVSKDEVSFYQVLEDLIGDFQYDIQNGQVKGLKDVAIRDIALSENIPVSFKTHLQLLITEKLIKTAKIKVIECLACRARKTIMQKDKMVLSVPSTNPAQLSKIAKENGIENFLDVAFTFQSHNMILSASLTDAEMGYVVWSKTYNSENTRAAAIRRGVDIAEIDQLKIQTEYTVTTQARAISYFLYEPNITPKSTACIALGFRFMERYNNRKAEVGFEVNYLMNASSIIKKNINAQNDLYKFPGFNFTVLFMHTWNFIGAEENYNYPRHNLTLGVGGTITSIYIGALLRAAYEIRLGRRFVFQVPVGYRPISSTVSTSTALTSVGGVEYGFGFSFLF